MGGYLPGANIGPQTSYGSVPGAPAAGTAPDPGGEAAKATDMTNEQMALMTQALQQAATPRFGGGQQPAVPGAQQPMSPTPPSYMTNVPYPSRWGPERFMYQMQSSIQQLSQAKRERDVAKAENLYTNMATAAQKYMTPDGKFNADAAAKDPFLSSLKDSDYKKMADTLHESWLDPRATGPHQDGLKLAQEKFKQKQQGRQGLDKFIQGLIHKATGPFRGGPQLTPEQQQQETQQILGRAPIGAAGGTDKEALEMSNILYKNAQINRMLQTPGQWIQGTDADGNPIWAQVPKNITPGGGPPPVEVPKIPGTDRPLGGKLLKEGQPSYSPVTGALLGVQHNNRFVPVNSAEFQNVPDHDVLLKNNQDQVVQRQLFRIDPKYAIQAGDMPLPSKYPLGAKDPAYRADLNDYGKKIAELEIKDKQAVAGTAAVIRAGMQTREVLTHDPQGNPTTEFKFVKDIVDRPFSSAAQGTKDLSGLGQMQDIQVASARLRAATLAPGMDKTFTPTQLAILTKALSATDDSVVGNEMKALATTHLTDAQQDWVNWVNQINERALSLRNIAKQGQGSDMTRGAIIAMLPNVGSGDQRMMIKQLDAFDNQTDIYLGNMVVPGGFTRPNVPGRAPSAPAAPSGAAAAAPGAAAPPRPKGVPGNAIWNPQLNRWQLPK